MTHIYDQSINNPQDRVIAPPQAPINNNAVSWGAIFAGAAAAASLALIMLMLGSGLGLMSVSPWQNHGADAGTIGIVTIVWLAVTQIVASGMGGYLAGRLRTKWVDTHVDEIYFRDTAHGFLTWAVALLVSTILLTTTVGSIIGGGAKAVGSVAGGAANLTNTATSLPRTSMTYFVHSMFRTANPSQPANPPTAPDASSASPVETAMNAPHQSISPAQLAEITGIFANSMSTGTLPQEDQQYVAQIISQSTGINQQEAEQRVKTTYDKAQAKLKETKVKAQQLADAARKTTSYLLLWTFISLLIGAFAASLCATFGGRQRDL